MKNTELNARSREVSNRIAGTNLEAPFHHECVDPRTVGSHVQPRCLDPTTPILTRELQWVFLGDLAEGDEVWAFDEMPKGQTRRTTITPIEAVSWARKPAFAVTTQSGATVVASKEHRFLSYSGGSTLAWRRLETMFRPYGEGKKAALAVWMPPWQPRADFDGGWLSGMYDGEGSISKRNRNGSSLYVAITQNAGPVLERVKVLLTADGFDYGVYASNGQKTAHNLGLRGGIREYLRFLGSYRPQRLLNKLMASNCDLELWLAPDPIVDITAVGMKDLVDIQTREGTYFANGFAVHDSTNEALTWRFGHDSPQAAASPVSASHSEPSKTNLTVGAGTQSQ